MRLAIRRSFKVLAPGGSLRRRVALSLAVVRLILVPVIFFAIYYLLVVGRIVDRIVSFDAPAATLSQQASIEMLEARRAERNYLLLYDPSSLQANRESISKLEQILRAIRELNAADQPLTDQALAALHQYDEEFKNAVASMQKPGEAPADRIQSVLQAYEKDLGSILKGARNKPQEQLIEELRARIGSFDTQITKTAQEGNPALKQITTDLQNSGQDVLRLTSELEARNWDRIDGDHRRARRLISHSEWALSIVSAITLLVSIWISFVLPQQVVRPLMSLKEAVDHAAAGNYEIEFEIRGEGEVVQLANSIRLLISHVKERYEGTASREHPAV
jgi:nitrogen fixation/metabolism regulation signal transduction histidine kinase